MKIEEFVEKVFQEIHRQENLIKMYKSYADPLAPGNAIGRISGMHTLYNKSVPEVALRQTEEKLKRLYTLLDRINEANFGKCAKCGTKILEGDLLLKPGSILCIKCAR